MANFRNRKACGEACRRIRSRRLDAIKREKRAKESPAFKMEREEDRVNRLYAKYAEIYRGPPYRCARPVETVKYRVM